MSEHTLTKICKTCKRYLIGIEQKGERCNKCLTAAAKRSTK